MTVDRIIASQRKGCTDATQGNPDSETLVSVKATDILAIINEVDRLKPLVPQPITETP